MAIPLYASHTALEELPNLLASLHIKVGIITPS